MNVVTDFAVYVASTKIGTHGIVMLIGLIHVAVVSVKVIVVTIVFRHEAIPVSLSACQADYVWGPPASCKYRL